MTTAFEELKATTMRCVATADGIRQADVARLLGIPSSFDNNWITKGLLDGLVDEGRLTKDERKLFRIK